MSAWRFVLARITTRRMVSRSDDATVVMPRKLLELNARRVDGHEPLESRRDTRSPAPRHDRVDKVEESGEREHVRDVEAESWSSRTRAATPLAMELSVLRTKTTPPKQTAARREDTPSAPPLARDVAPHAVIAGPPRTPGARARGIPLGARLGGIAVIFAFGILIGVLASLRTRMSSAAAAAPLMEPALEVMVSPPAAAPPAEPSAVVELSASPKSEAPKPDASKAIPRPHRSVSHTHAAVATAAPAPRPPPPVAAKRAKNAPADPTSSPASAPAADPDEALDAANVADTLAKEQLDSLIQ
jgi:hypothetical protein